MTGVLLAMIQDGTLGRAGRLPPERELAACRADEDGGVPAVGERPPLRQVLDGPSDDPFGSLNLVGGLRRSMAKAGYCDLKEFQKVGLTVGS